MTQRQVNNLLQELKNEGKVTYLGSKKKGVWELVIN